MNAPDMGLEPPKPNQPNKSLTEKIKKSLRTSTWNTPKTRQGKIKTTFHYDPQTHQRLRQELAKAVAAGVIPRLTLEELGQVMAQHFLDSEPQRILRKHLKRER